jgi:hypothetical protein
MALRKAKILGIERGNANWHSLEDSLFRTQRGGDNDDDVGLLLYII